MDAKELNAIYAPLWEKVPGTQPQTGTHRLEFYSEFPGPPPSFVWWPKAAHGGDCPRVASVEAAAMCRVAVEDWLDERGVYVDRATGVDIDGNKYVILQSWSEAFASVANMRSDPAANDGDNDEYPCEPGKGEFWEHDSRGPTIHHALVAGALTVADVH